MEQALSRVHSPSLSHASRIPVTGPTARRRAIRLAPCRHRAGNELNLLDPIAFVEPTLVFSIGASGGFDPDGRPTIYRRALELVSSGKVLVLPSVTHRYRALDQIHKAFEEDFMRQDYIKGV